jgi:hypothetical protein
MSTIYSIACESLASTQLPPALTLYRHRTTLLNTLHTLQPLRRLPAHVQDADCALCVCCGHYVAQWTWTETLICQGCNVRSTHV